MQHLYEHLLINVTASQVTLTRGKMYFSTQYYNNSFNNSNQGTTTGIKILNITGYNKFS